MAKRKQASADEKRIARKLVIDRAHRGELKWPDAVHDLRTALGMSQSDFGRLFKLSRRQISEIENGRSNTTIETISRIAKPFGLAVGLVPSSSSYVTEHSPSAADILMDTAPPIRVFFSFSYDRDLWRVNQVRNTSLISGIAAAGWHDPELWEDAKRKGDASLRSLINQALAKSSVTVVCVGYETHQNKYIDYEIKKSIEKGNILLGLRINHLPDMRGNIDSPGLVPERLRKAGAPIIPFTTPDNLAKTIQRIVRESQQDGAA